MTNFLMRAPDTGRPAPGPGRDFSFLVGAYAIQTLGEGVLIAALPLLASHLTRNPRLVSWVALAQELPWLLLALPGVVVIDRYNRRRLMLGTQALQAMLLAVTGLLVIFGTARLWMLYLLAFGLGSGDILFTGSSRAVVSAVVRPDQVDTAMGREATAEALGRQFLGPPLGSALFAFLLPLPFWFDAVTYTLSLLLIYRIRDTAGRFQPQRPVRDPGAAPARRALLAEATEGLRYMARHRVLRVIVALAATSNFAVYMALSVLVLYAEEVLRVGSRGYGVLVAAMAVGGVLGALVSRRVVVSLGPRVVAIGVSLASALSLIAIGLFGHSPVTVAALFCIWSAGLSIWNVMAQTLSLQLVPDELRGRVTSGSRMAAFGALPLGALAGGFVAGAYGLRAPWLVGGLVHLTVALIFLPALLRLPQVTPVRASESEASD
jgi:predicted MFS family arabinose efflux permease